MSIDDLADKMTVSKNYVATRLRGERIFTLRDFEEIAAAFDLDPEEFLVRVTLPLARNFDGRMVPKFGIAATSERGVIVFQHEESEAPVGSPFENVTRADFSGNRAEPNWAELDEHRKVAKHKPSEEPLDRDAD